MNKTAFYIGNFFFPDGNAAGKRVFGNIKALQEAGYKTVCLCFRMNGKKKYLDSDFVENTHIYTIPYCQGFARMDKRKPLKAFFYVLEKEIKSTQTTTIIMYGSLGSANFNLAVCKYAKKSGIRVLYDYVDLFNTPAKRNYLRYVAKKHDLKVLEQKVLPDCNGYITISSYLKNLVPRPENAVIIPPLAVKVVDTPAKANDIVTISYASVISDKSRPISEWKDRIDSIVSAAYDLNVIYHLANFKFQMIGFTKESLLEMLEEHLREDFAKKIEVLAEHIVFLGPMKNQKAQEYIYNSDYTILLRDSKTSTNAGFPTKVSESIALGVPVIANETSDLGEYINNGENGFLVPAPSEHECLVKSLVPIVSMDVQQRDELKHQTLAGCRFHYSQYVQQLSSIAEQATI